jgi:2-amino-4-hydroxy-6-hydroxymethyldihydropteridine diphosphokinase
MIHKAILILGSNIGDKKSYLNMAITEIRKRIGDIVNISSTYQSDAWGKEDQDCFYNQVLIVKTKHSSSALLDKILEIENEIGRIRHEKWGSRIIDIDILFYNDEIINKVDLIIPHPLMQDRKFVLMPLSELCPDLIHPQLKLKIKDILNSCFDKLVVVKI